MTFGARCLLAAAMILACGRISAGQGAGRMLYY